MNALRSRCLMVALGLTAALWGAAAVGLRALVAGSTADPAAALDRLCLAALVLAAGWAWLQGMAGVADAWRGASRQSGSGATPSVVRRLAMAACGATLATALCAGATPGALADERTPHADPLSGLPLPDRAEGPAHPHAHPQAHPQTLAVLVRTGDTLWALAESRLPAAATAREVSAAWHEIYRHNRDVIGPDPDLIRPGQVLTLTKENR
jgi:nucleoid-associated protein YgaU